MMTVERDARITKLEDALRCYERDFCEGFCANFPPDVGHADCSGCRARIALQQEPSNVTRIRRTE